MTPTPQLSDSRRAIALLLEQDDAARWQGAASGIAAAWWQTHPLRATLNLAIPVVCARVRDKPVQTLALAAGAGAILVIARPWRLVSAAGLALALIRSARIPAILRTLLATQGR